MRILLVHRDPEPELTRSLAYEGHDVLTVRADERPARLLGVFNPDVVLVIASDPSGATRALRRHSLEVPIVAIAAHGDVEERIAALAAGADDCLGWPFDRAELSARIRAVCRRTLFTEASAQPDDEHTFRGAA